MRIPGHNKQGDTEQCAISVTTWGGKQREKERGRDTRSKGVSERER